MTREEIEELKGLAASMGLYDDKNPCKRALILGKAIKALEQEPCEDTISRKSIKQKLQEHHDFFVNAYGGFSNLPQNDKSKEQEDGNR